VDTHAPPTDQTIVGTITTDAGETRDATLLDVDAFFAEVNRSHRAKVFLAALKARHDRHARVATIRRGNRSTTREHRSPSKSRTISRRARTSATSTADPSSSRPRGGTRPLRSVRIETTRLALRLALLVIGGSR
jgi:hypothetical protein